MTSTRTLIKYIKPTEYNSEMFLIEELSDEHIGSLYIKNYNDRDWTFIYSNKIRPNSSILIPKRVYELEIKERKWNDKIVRTYHLHNTFETLNYKKNKHTQKSKNVRCLFGGFD